MTSHITSREIKHRTISSKEWEEVKLVFEDLYLKKRRNYRQISEYLCENHGFYPTKNQFKKRVRLWGLEKNSRKSSAEAKGGERRSSSRPAALDMVMISNTHVNTLFNLAGIVGPFDTDDENMEEQCNLQFFSSDQLESMTWVSLDLQMPTLHTSSSPFPTSLPTKSSFWNSGRRRKITIERARAIEPQCARKFKKLSQLSSDQVIELAQGMQQIADVFYDKDLDSRAELWYRRVVTAKQRVRTYEPVETLRACMGVVNSMNYQFRYSDAQALHRDFNVRLQKLLPPQHNLFLESKQRWSSLLGHFGIYGEEETEQRELLQIHLSMFGPLHHSTLTALSKLARCLHDRESYIEGEALLRTTLSILQQRESPQLKEWTIETDMTLRLLRELAVNLQGQARYLEAERILVNAKQRYGNFPKGYRNSFELDYEMAQIMYQTMRRTECEKILNALLQPSPEIRFNSYLVIKAAQLFAHNLYQMGKIREAIPWYKKVLELRGKIYGQHHPKNFVIWSFLGSCYTLLGMYEEVHSLYVQSINGLENWPRKDYEASPTKQLKKLRKWLHEVEVIRSLPDAMIIDDNITGYEEGAMDAGEDLMDVD